MTTEKFPGDLRDWFAGQPLTDEQMRMICDQRSAIDKYGVGRYSQQSLRYFHADRMLAARGSATTEPDWRGIVTSLLDIIHDDLTHERQAAHAAALTAARRAVGRG